MYTTGDDDNDNYDDDYDDDNNNNNMYAGSGHLRNELSKIHCEKQKKNHRYAKNTFYSY
jgi:hypothetical protein